MVDDPSLPSPTADPDATRAPVPSDRAGDAIGPYRFLQKIGEGGMGEVWVAEQHEPLLLRGYDGLRASRGETHDLTVEAARRVAELYEARGKPEKAIEWRKKLPPPK